MQASTALDLGDDDFLATFDRAGFDSHSFPHRAHLRLAWLCVRRLGAAGAGERVTRGIRALAASHGHAARYHETLTRAWVYAVAAADAERPAIATFEGFLEANPELLDKNYLLRHYSALRLASPEARARWLSPDLQPIPGVPDPPMVAETSSSPVPALPIEEFRRVMEHVPLAVAIMAAHDATRVHGTTVSSVAAIARDPVMLVACVRGDSRILPIMRAAGGFGISYLNAGQRAIATRFADRARGEDVAQFGGVPHALGPFGAPIVAGGPAWFECRLHEEFGAGSHHVVCGTVVAAGSTGARPLQRVGGAWV